MPCIVGSEAKKFFKSELELSGTIQRVVHEWRPAGVVLVVLGILLVVRDPHVSLAAALLPRTIPR